MKISARFIATAFAVIAMLTVCNINQVDAQVRKASGGEGGLGSGRTGGGLGGGLSGLGGRGLGGGGGAPSGPATALYDDDEIEMAIRMYQVADLLNEFEHKPFRGFTLPGIGNKSLFEMPTGGGQMGAGGPSSGGGLFAVSPQMGGGGGGGFGGGGLGGGPGMFSSMMSNPVIESISMDDLIDSIMYSVTPDEWEDNGGPGSIRNLSTVLVINQTPAIHDKIDQFLAMLRDTQANRSTVTIKATWLTVNEDELQSIRVIDSQQVDKQALSRLAKNNGVRGQVTAFNGQTVHIAAGNLISTIESVVPVVGQNDLLMSNPLRLASAKLPEVDKLDNRSNQPVAKTPKHIFAQQLGTPAKTSGAGVNQESSAKVGYQPVSRWINYGAVLQVTPKTDVNAKRLTLDISSVLIKAGDGSPAKKAATGVSGIDLDSHNLNCQQFQSRVRLEASAPTLVGGSGFQTDDSRQIYLVIEAIVNTE